MKLVETICPRKRYLKHMVALLAFTAAIGYLIFFQSMLGFPRPDVDPLTQFTLFSSSSMEEAASGYGDQVTVALPDDWYHSKRESNDYWYSTSVELDVAAEAIWAVYIPFVTHNAAVYINGMWVGQGGKFTDPVSRHHNEPLMFSFASELLRPGLNRIDIRVKAALPRQGLLDQIYLAPQSALIDFYVIKHALRYDFVQWVTVFLIVLGLLVFAFWIARPQDTVYGYFSAVLLLWALHNLNLIIINIPVPNRTWEAFAVITLGWVVCAVLLFNHRYTRQHQPRMERALYIYGVSGLFLFALPDHELVVLYGYQYWYVFLLFFGSYAIFQLHRSFWRNFDLDVLLMMYAGVTILVCGVHDILVANHHWDRREGFYIQYSVVPATLLFAWFLLKRFVTSLNTAEELTATLELRVEQREKALQEQFERLRVFEKHQTLSQERERMMRDMHDGIGGQLISLAAVFREESHPKWQEAKRRIDDCLLDLRLVIDSLDPLLCDLPTLLGTLRMRLVQQLKQAGLEIDWQVTQLPDLRDSGPQRNLHILRIVQEAITNAIRHSGTQRIRVRSTVTDEQKVLIEVIDYGNGFSVGLDPVQGGRGLQSMSYRAAQIGCELTVKSDDSGTVVSLSLDVVT